VEGIIAIGHVNRIERPAEFPHFAASYTSPLVLALVHNRRSS